MDQQIRFCTTPDKVRICYATSGAGTPLVKAANWLSHLEFDWRSPIWRHWWEELSRDNLLIRYDERGCGLSDWKVEQQEFAAWVTDLESVVEASGLDRFALVGISQGGAVAVEYAVRHPERVSHLILYGSFARGRAHRGQTSQQREEESALNTLIRLGWGRDNFAFQQIFASRFVPGATEEQMQWFNELQRISTSPENAVRIRQEYANIDILERLPRVAVPTLVLHGRGDATVPFEEGRQLAALIPNALFVPLESNNHILLENEPAWRMFLFEVRQFLHREWPNLASASGPPTPSHSPVDSNPLRRGPLRDTSKVSEYPDGLTVREVEVLRLLAAGKSNPQIGEELFISARTVGHHVSSILNKTGTSSRSEAAAYAVRLGLA